MKLTKVKILKQYDIGNWIGAYYSQLMNSMSYTSLFSYTMIAVTMWNTSNAMLRSIIPWLTLPIFFALAICICFGIIPYLDYVFMYKARQRFQSVQSYLHGNPFKADMDELKMGMNETNKSICKQNENMGKQDKRLARIEKALGIIEDKTDAK